MTRIGDHGRAVQHEREVISAPMTSYKQNKDL